MIGYIILSIVIVCLGGYVYKLSQANKEVVEINNERRKEISRIEQEIQNKQQEYTRLIDTKNQEKAAITQIIETKQQELERLKQNVDAQNELVVSLTKTAEELRTRAEDHARESAQAAFAQTTKELQNKYTKMDEDLQTQLALVLQKIEEETDKLNDLKAKQLAYLAAKQREEEKEANLDYYRLVLGEIDQGDISILRELQKRLSHKEAIDKLIWEVYYKPAYDVLMSHFFKSASAKICGIYKIESIKTGAAYIGQSVDIRERWRNHIKASLSSAPATNILYQSMKKYGPENFTFEILEEVPRDKLNEREVYWIDFYNTKERGMNKTKGGS